MKEFSEYLEKIENPEHRKILSDILEKIEVDFPELEKRIAWNQPMFTHHGTFIIGFSTAKNHFSVSPEGKTIDVFKEKISACGYDYGKMIIKFPWKEEVNYGLIKKMVEYNIVDKADVKTFWRK